jgi:hypothetical protein
MDTLYLQLKQPHRLLMAGQPGGNIRKVVANPWFYNEVYITAVGNRFAVRAIHTNGEKLLLAYISQRALNFILQL